MLYPYLDSIKLDLELLDNKYTMTVGDNVYNISYYCYKSLQYYTKEEMLNKYCKFDM